MKHVCALILIGFLVSSASVQAAEDANPFNIDLTPDNSAILLPTSDTLGANQTKPPSGPGGLAPSSSVIQNALPDISFLGDMIGGNPAALTLPGGELHSPVYIRELEVDAAGYVSPYAKGFFVMSVEGDGSVDIEEAYMNFFTLPWGANFRLGKTRVDIDTVNPLHQHALPFVDFPLILEHLFGEEGLKMTGANLSFLVPNPWDHYVMLSLNVGANPDYTNAYSVLYGSTQQQLVYTARLGSSWDIADASYLNADLTTIYAPLQSGTESRTFLGDVLIRYAPNPVSDAYTLLAGYYWNQADLKQTGHDLDTDGLYAYLGRQFSSRWKVGYRYDRVNDPNSGYGGLEQQHNAIVSFYPTETNYIRVQYGYHQLPTDAGATWENKVWFQVNWGLGPHQLHMNL